MKRTWYRHSVYLALLALVILMGLPALAEQGQDITAQCRFAMRGLKEKRQLAFDRRYKTAWTCYGKDTAEIVIKLPAETKQGGIYLCFAADPDTLVVLSDDREIHRQVGPGYAHRYLPFEGDHPLTVQINSHAHVVSISEIFVFSGEHPPAWVQRWQPSLEQADLLVLVAHPDDELLWMGGAIPYYALERQKRVAVAYMTCANALRRSELLNGLWAAGIQHYPFIGSFQDRTMSSLKKSFDLWGGEEHVISYVTALYRQLKPQVLLTHDLKGEYGHRAHVVTARAAAAALFAAPDPTMYPDSAQQHGVWDVPKAYLHLYHENSITIDWQQPIAMRGGVTALEVAKEAFAQHRSANPKYQVKATGPYSPTRFGLYRSLVGDDLRQDDFFENLDD